MATFETREIHISGMDCAECTQHAPHAIEKLNGMQPVNVFLATATAIIRYGPTQADMPTIRSAAQGAGNDVSAFVSSLPAPIQTEGASTWLRQSAQDFNRRLTVLLAGGYPVFRHVMRATLNRQVIWHTLTTLGVIAALAVGQWVTALLVVIFMRIGDYVENFTTESARSAVRELTSLVPQTARVERDGVEKEMLPHNRCPASASWKFCETATAEIAG